jgi:hypothetical protein
MCGGNKDQTSTEILKFVVEMVRGTRLPLSSVKGTGMFLVPAPENGILETRTVIVADLTHTDARKRGENCLAFQWVPDDMMKHSEVSAFFAKSDDERALFCNDFCNFAGGRCPVMCWCPPTSNFCGG